MKKHLSKWAVLALLAGTFAIAPSLSASAQVYVHVRERPVAPVIVRTAPPSPRHVWIGEEWESRNGVYVHTGGHWALPPHHGQIWVSGHWVHDGRGNYWKPGHWRYR